jgi:hypothetical protein
MYDAMTKGKSKKRQTMVEKKLHRKLKIEQHELQGCTQAE